MRALSRLTFNSDAHRYRYDGQPMVGVSEVLKGAGLVDTRFFTDEARLQGTYIHAALALDHEGALDDGALDPALVPYVAGWRWLKREMHLTPLLWETAICDPAVGYAGTFDLVAVRRVSPLADPEYWLIDFKRSAPPMSAAIQTAAYRRAIVWMPEPDAAADLLPVWREVRGQVIRRAIVTWDGETCRPMWMPFEMRHSARDEQRWLAALEIYRCKQEMGLLA